MTVAPGPSSSVSRGWRPPRTALIVSSSLYQDLVETEFEGLDPKEFHPVEITAKGAVFPAYIHRGAG